MSLLFGLLLSQGCTGLPKDVIRPVSSAISATEPTDLGQLVDSRRASAVTPYASGFMLLSGPQDAYSSRLALAQRAQKSLDLQYYAIHADTSTAHILQSVVEAAGRGVRVRVLLDDFHSTGRDAQVMRLAFIPNIEMRMFNPLKGPRGSTMGRMFSALTDFARVQQRMHNKLFVADNAMGITGGRNLGDAYFGTATAGNFVDVDVLAVGPIVHELSRSFDSYWNNERSYPVESLVTQQELDAMRTNLQATETPGGRAPHPSDAPNMTEADPLQTPIWNNQPMDLALAPLTWAPAAVLVDKPAKIPTDASMSGNGLPESAPAKATPLAITSGALHSAKSTATAPGLRKAPQNHEAAPPHPGETSLDRASGPRPSFGTQPSGATHNAQPADAQTDTVVDGLLQLIRRARQDLLIVSPYFVPGADMKQAFAAARAKGVRVRVLTNSLASNDAPIAHAGYARHRPDLLALGVELFEMRSELPNDLRGMLGSSGKGHASASGSGVHAPGGSRAMLHSKLLVMDGQLLVVGSMNLDMRSQLQNTEIAVLVRSPSLSRRATEQIESALNEAAWRVSLDGDALVWRAPHGTPLEDVRTEPGASLPLRWMIQLLGPFAPDHLL